VDDEQFRQFDDDQYDEEIFDLDDDVVEGFCVRCRETVEIEDPQPVWTRKGMPATRGDCPICGGAVFRMGKTQAHSATSRPSAVQVGSAKRKQPKLAQDTVYVNFSLDDEIIAEQIADDLRKTGIAVWLHEHDVENGQVHWAGGVHPALRECARMVVVLSPSSLSSETVSAAWKFFKEKRKPIVIAQVIGAEPPDPIRRSPRFDFNGDYKSAFRQMIQALSQ
jgi:hypothetical protein